jgi:hypothetical protein
MNVDNFQPAFPTWISDDSMMQGMTLRDYFAGQAVKYIGFPHKVFNGRLGDNVWLYDEMEQFPYEGMAQIAYTFADAMLKIRNKNESV